MPVRSDDILNAIGLERRRDSTDVLLPALALFGAGVVVGAALGLLLAPKSGSQLRREIRDTVADNRAVKAVEEQVQALSRRVHTSTSSRAESEAEPHPPA